MDSIALRDRVWWTDPDGDVASGPGTVIRIREESAVILMDDAGEAEAWTSELRPLTAEEAAAFAPSPEAAVALQRSASEVAI